MYFHSLVTWGTIVFTFYLTTPKSPPHPVFIYTSNIPPYTGMVVIFLANGASMQRPDGVVAC